MLNIMTARIAANIHRYCKTYRNQKQYEDARTNIPYLLQRTSRGWLILNRYYKPLYRPNGDNVDYESTEFDDVLIVDGMMELDLRLLMVVTREALYFYDGTCPPYSGAKFRRAYLKKIEQCFGLQGEFL